VVTANGAVIDDNVPGPESYGVPLRNVSFASWLALSLIAHLLDFEALLVAFSAGTGLGSLRLCYGRICHINVGHVFGVCRMCRGGVCGELVRAVTGGGWR